MPSLIMLLSGAAALAYEVVWMRMLGRAFGVTVYAAAAVVAVYMAGLALGAAAAAKPRPAHRALAPGLRVYAALETALALAALAGTAWLARLPALLSARGYDAPLALGWRVLLSLPALLPATFLMGTTLPVLVRRLRGRGPSVAALYGANTLGAMLGVAVTAFATLGAWGERRTILAAAALNLAAALAALAYPGATAEPAPSSRAGAAPARGAAPGAAAWLFGISGFCALGYEILWSRQLTLLLGNSTYAFSVILVVYLAGIGLGSLWAPRLSASAPLVLFAELELGVSCAVLASLALFRFLGLRAASPAQLYSPVLGRADLLRLAVQAVLLILPAAAAMGALFPVAVRLAREEDEAASAARMYAFNTVGGILGSALVGFGLLGALGVHGSLRALALLNAALAAAALRLARPARGLRRAAALAFAAAVLFVATRRDPTLDILAARLDARLRLLFHEEDAAATVTGAALGSGRTLFINGIEIAGNGHAGALMAFLPNLLLESPRSALVICFGAGQTFRTASLLSSRVDAVELLEPVLRHAGDFLPDVPALMSAPGRAVYAEDGRQFLLRSRSRYDSIIVDAAPPLFSAGAVNLYTREFMDLARARLADDGVFALWLPLRSFESDYWSILRGVGQGFEHVAVWSHPSAEGFLVLASRRPIRPPAAAELSRRIRERLAPLGPDAVRGVRADALLAGFVLSEEDLRAYAGRYPVVTDDRPLTEFPLWRFLRDEPLMADARFLLKARR